VRPPAGPSAGRGCGHINIIICDDDPCQVDEVSALLSARKGYTLYPFPSGTEVLENLPEHCDIAILDIRLKDMLGIELAAKLQKIYPSVDIIYISSFPQYVTAAIRQRASQFLIKPINEKTFFREFDFILSKRASSRFHWVLTTKDTVYSLLPAEIVYIEAYHRHLYIHTNSAVIDVCRKLSDAAQTLEAYGFCQCHQDFLVNLDRIKQIDRDQLICSNGKVIPVSGRKRRNFLLNYAQFLTRSGTT
jgi:DNA-binding LytR/AlgR family response regulator